MWVGKAEQAFPGPHLLPCPIKRMGPDRGLSRRVSPQPCIGKKMNLDGGTTGSALGARAI